MRRFPNEAPWPGDHVMDDDSVVHIVGKFESANLGAPFWAYGCEDDPTRSWGEFRARQCLSPVTCLGCLGA